MYCSCCQYFFNSHIFSLSVWLSLSLCPMCLCGLSFSFSFQLDSGKEYTYTPPTQPPIHPPYEQACFMRKNNLLAKEDAPAASLDRSLSAMQLSASEDQEPPTSDDQGGCPGTSVTEPTTPTDK